MKKLENTNEYIAIVEKIKNGDENAKKELVNFTFLEMKDIFIESMERLKVRVAKQEIDGLIYSLLGDYIENSHVRENYREYRGVVIRAVESRLLKYKKQPKNKKETLFDHTAEEVDKKIVVNEGIIDPDEEILRKEFNDIFRHLIIEYLRPREQTILIQYFGLDGNGTTTLKELGKKYNLTREKIRQVIARGLKSIKAKLRVRKDNSNIKDYADDFRV